MDTPRGGGCAQLPTCAEGGALTLPPTVSLLRPPQVTKHVNAATRMVLDSVRTLIIWTFSLGIGWESFCWVQAVGFVILLAGIVVYNELIRLPAPAWAVRLCGSAEDDEEGKGASGVDDPSAAADEYAAYGTLEDDSNALLIGGSVNNSGKGRK